MAGKVKLWLLFLILAAGFIAGCAADVPANLTTKPSQTPAQSASEPTVVQSPAKQPTAMGNMRLTVYYATKDAENLVPVTYEVAKNTHPARTAVELLLTRPQNPDLVSVFPAGTKLKDIAVKKNIAYVDFNQQLLTGTSRGSATELLLVGAVVDTLTEFSDIQQVQILVEGKKLDTLYGHVDLSEPLSRSVQIIKKTK
ncbi:sporulation and spore germination [Lucifera butyrica]|uniref:Sporulation and spore germination n=1 Tax=Lucifera butyrica TaxID=1351585 RepID=A0A498R9K2_9FIRM|nr:GerMN domain-containing protein [Lucifera butyrica]VBB05818.1 sporulation and spore germination [Lucifera butyrica]